ELYCLISRADDNPYRIWVPYLRFGEQYKVGFTHFTYDVSEELKKDLNQTITRICDLYFFTQELRGKENFSTEISLDETEEPTKLGDLTFLLEELKRNKVQVDEIAPRFPGYFEKGIDYYWKKESGKNIRDTKAFEEYLEEVVRISKKFGFRISIHSGSDKFSLYPIISRVTKNNFHLKTAGTHYLE
ncbi:tagaturonate epimerase, partial [Candidatus Hakubella thermalkaliphila]